jgi:acylphosphatase
MPHAAFRAIVHGRVQGVFFRASAREEAERLGIGGWVRNLPDGTVEVDAAGAEPTLRAFAAWLERGPRQARVDRVEATWGTREGVPPAGFAITG